MLRLKFVPLIVFIVVISGITQAQEANRLFGKIYFNTTLADKSNVVTPYRDLKIEILQVIAEPGDTEIKSQKILFTTYPDSNGFFTFKNVPESNYLLRISHFKVGENGLIDEIIQEIPIQIKYDANGKARLNPIGIDIFTVPDNDK